MKPRSHESGENYLEAVLILSQEKGYCRSVDVADSLGITKPSVSVAVSRLVKEGYLTTDEDKFLHLTARGHILARETYEKHCFFKEKLMAAGVPEEKAEVEACSIEHALSYDSFMKLKTMFRDTPEQEAAPEAQTAQG